MINYLKKETVKIALWWHHGHSGWYICIRHGSWSIWRIWAERTLLRCYSTPRQYHLLYSL